MTTPRDPVSLSREDLLALVAGLPRQVAEVIASHEVWRAEIEQLKRGGTRQAAPFSTGTRVTEPKAPGRRPGSGPFRSREAPPPDAMTEPPVEGKVTLDACPTCGGRLQRERVDVAYTTERPQHPRPQVTPSRVWVCRCTTCGIQVRGPHPDVPPNQAGATAHRRGPRVMAAAHVLHDGVGLPVRKIPAVLAALTGVRLTQGALTQDARRRTMGPVGTADGQLRTAVPEAPVVHTADTGWRVGGEPAHLMAFETDAVTVDQIRRRHRHQEVPEVIPAASAGVMVTDRGRRYDAQAFDGVDQQQCLAHILRSIRDVVETKTGRARDVGAPLEALWPEALARWHESREGKVPHDKVEAEALQAAMTSHLRDRRLQDPDNQRRLHELGWHHDRGNRRRFLTDPRLEPTNNRAERALRPAVIARTVSHGSNNARGSHACAACMSVVRTLAKHSAEAIVEDLSHVCRTATLPGVPC